MKRILLPLLVFACFIFEGTVMQVFSPENYGFEMILVPRFVIILIIFIGLYKSTAEAVVYGIVTGLLYDIVYTDLIGVYMFSMAVTAYIVALSARVIHVNLIAGILLALVAVTILDSQVYGLYILTSRIDISITHFLHERLYPSYILNGVFFILVYFPMRKLIERMT